MEFFLCEQGALLFQENTSPVDFLWLILNTPSFCLYNRWRHSELFVLIHHLHHTENAFVTELSRPKLMKRLQMS